MKRYKIHWVEIVMLLLINSYLFCFDEIEVYTPMHSAVEAYYNFDPLTQEEIEFAEVWIENNFTYNYDIIATALREYNFQSMLLGSKIVSINNI